MFTATGIVLLLLFGYSTPALNTRCFPLNEGGSYCFTQPDPLVALSWSSAQQWCKNIGATLPIPDTNYHHVVYGNALGYFGLHTETLWLGANSTYNVNNWYWTNRTIFTGAIENRNTPSKTHAYLRRNGTNTQFVAASPFEYNSHICQYYYSEVTCGNYANSYWTGGKCYIKYKYSWFWYQSSAYCGQSNLATIDNLNELSKWLEDLAKFWIGLRSTWWTWQDIVTGTSREVVESQFGSNLPNGSSAECLASYRDIGLNIRWINLNCTSNLQFICQQYVNITTTTTTTSTTKTTTSTTSSTSTTATTPTTRTTTSTSTTSTTTIPRYSLATASDGGTATSSTQTKINSDSNSINYGLIVGLVLGLVVILPLTIITVAVIVCNVRLRRRLRENTGNNERVTTAAKTSQVNLDRSIARVDAADPDVQYLHLKRETMLGPDTSMPLYDQLNQPENRDYELIIENT